MPELPEVETIRRDLNSEFAGCIITGIDCFAPTMLKPSPAIVLKGSVGQKIIAVSRIGKLLLINLANTGTLALHLKLTGQLFIRDPKDKKDNFTYVVFHFDNGKELRFTEMRKFGFVKFIKEQKELKDLVAEYGPEPLTPGFTVEALSGILNKTTRPVKVVIMDQKKIAGVGNIYADESLWYSKIHPETKAGKLSALEVTALFKNINFVIKQGIEDRGTSVDTYLDAYGQRGGHDKNLQVFRREKNPCPRCNAIIKKIRVGGRGTHFCPQEQIYHD